MSNLIEYAGRPIRNRDEMLSLTDMWKAAGSDRGKRPVDWLRSADAERFVNFVADTLNVGISHNDVVTTVRGGKAPGTFAHWQIAMAYAKYLSPEFHMWCNTVVRAHMEHRLPAHSDFPAELVEMIKRTDGIVRMLAHKVTKIEQAVEGGVQHEPASFTITVQPTKGKAA